MTDSEDTQEDTLAHFGVKGMQWGKRRNPDAKKRESRSDYKSRVAKEQDEFYQKKMDGILEKAIAGGDKVLIQTRYAGDTARTISTGKELVQELSRGRAFDVRVTEIFAEQTKEGPYQMTGDSNIYQKTKRGAV